MNPDLSQLRDIHLPEPISWWPPAPGWWLIAAVISILIVSAFFFIRQRHHDRWRREALSELKNLQNTPPQEQLARLSVLLRRVALSRFPRAEVAALTGDAWLAFLDERFKDETPFQSTVGRLLLTGPYTVTIDGDVAAVAALCERWINHLPKRISR